MSSGCGFQDHDWEAQYVSEYLHVFKILKAVLTLKFTLKLKLELLMKRGWLSTTASLYV